jgi:hypothetical protein
MPDPNAPDLLSLAATGSLADVGPYLPPGTPRGWTYRRHQLHQTAYAKEQHPGYHIPPPYGGIFLTFSQLRAIWGTMTTTQRDTWKRIAKHQHLTPYLAFMQTNARRAGQNLNPILEP